MERIEGRRDANAGSTFEQASTPKAFFVLVNAECPFVFVYFVAMWDPELRVLLRYFIEHVCCARRRTHARHREQRLAAGYPSAPMGYRSIAQAKRPRCFALCSRARLGAPGAWAPQARACKAVSGLRPPQEHAGMTGRGDGAIVKQTSRSCRGWGYKEGVSSASILLNTSFGLVQSKSLALHL